MTDEFLQEDPGQPEADLFDDPYAEVELAVSQESENLMRGLAASYEGEALFPAEASYLISVEILVMNSDHDGVLVLEIVWQGHVAGYNTNDPLGEGYFISDHYDGTSPEQAHHWDLYFVALLRTLDGNEGFAVSETLSPAGLRWRHSLDWTSVGGDASSRVRMSLLAADDAGSWMPVDESILPGNENGFVAPPLDLCDLPTDTIRQLRIMAKFPPMPEGNELGLVSWSMLWIE